MRRTYASALLLLATAFMAAPASATDLDNVNAWLTSNVPWKVCPAPGSNNPNQPGFAFNNSALSTTPPLGVCRQSGPHVWQPTTDKKKMWWVQVFTNLRRSGCEGASSYCQRDQSQHALPAHPEPVEG